MRRIGLALPRSGVATSLEQARQIVRETGIPAIIRPSFTLGGTGGSIAFVESEFDGLVEWALQQSPRHQCLIEESVLGWKEFELEVMRDHQDNVVIICSIENFDPMGVHTGDSITVAPAQTLTDREYQEMRDAAVAIIREIGVDTGGSNIQFAVNPRDGKLVVIEMNPRVSRSSALASKATGFPIAKIAAKLAVGYTLDEIRNDITRVTPASFEPSIDYVVTKIPRFTFEKFPGVDNTLDHPDEVGGRGDGDRAHLQGEPAEGDPLARDRARGLRVAGRSRTGPRASARSGRRSTRRAPGGCGRWPRCCGAAARSRSCTPGRGSTPGSCATSRRSWRRSKQLAALPAPQRPAFAARRQAGGLLRPPAGGALGPGRGGGARAAPRAWRATRSTSASTPAPPSSRPSRPICIRPTRTSARRGPRRRARS